MNPLWGSKTFAQHSSYTSGNPAAVRAYEQAVLFYERRQNDKALDALKTVIEKDSNFVEAWILKGNVLDDQRKPEQGIEAYKKAIEIKPDFFAGVYFTLGYDEFRLGRYEEAKAHLQKFIAMPKVDKPHLNKANLIIASCDFAAEAIKHPVPFKPINLGDSINSKDDELIPTITADEKYFCLPCSFRGKICTEIHHGSKIFTSANGKRIIGLKLILLKN